MKQFPAFLFSIPILILLLLPVLALAISQSPGELLAGVEHVSFWPALRLSALTSLGSLALVVIAGMPLAWWLSQSHTPLARVVESLVDLPVVLPPAVVGVGLLMAFGRQGLLGPTLASAGVVLPFSTAAVVMAQIVVSAPFFLQAAISAFRGVDPELVIVAQTLGQTRLGAFIRVTLPLAAPGIVGGSALAWARALGEFGATLLFAGNMPGVTQTMPLAVYTAMESDVNVAVALSLVLALLGVVVLVGIRSWVWRRR